MEQTRPVTIYRWLVFLLAAFFFVESFRNLQADAFGWQFRFLTYWGLALSFVSAFFMLRRSLGREPRRMEVLASATVVINIMVVFLYWRIYLSDPTAFYENGVRTIPLWKEYYLHALGPILQWIDALFILGAFRKPAKTAGLVGLLAMVYFLWLEWIVAPLNTEPVGRVTSGLAYRFLNNMEISERVTFYAVNGGLSVVLVGVCTGLLFLMRRVFQQG